MKLDINKIYLNDCCEGMKNIDDNYIATCITDLPYNYEFIGKDWSNKEIIEQRTVPLFKEIV